MLTSLGNLAFQFGVKDKLFGRLAMAGRRAINGGSCRAGLLVARRFEDNLRDATCYKQVRNLRLHVCTHYYFQQLGNLLLHRAGHFLTNMYCALIYTRASRKNSLYKFKCDGR
jgi:hypothetical protein